MLQIPRTHMVYSLSPFPSCCHPHSRNKTDACIMQECKGVVICWQKSLKVIIRMETLVTVSLETKKCLGLPDIWDWYILQSVPTCQAINSAQVIGFWPSGHPVFAIEWRLKSLSFWLNHFLIVYLSMFWIVWIRREIILLCQLFTVGKRFWIW